MRTGIKNKQKWISKINRAWSWKNIKLRGEF